MGLSEAAKLIRRNQSAIAMLVDQRAAPPAQVRKWWHRLFAVGAVVVAAMAVGAQGRAAQGVFTQFRSISGNQLYEQCRVRSAFCYGYVEGISDGTYRLPNYELCFPEGVTAKQLVDVVTRYLAAHPETWHIEAGPLVAVALHEAFPCRQ